MSRIAATNLYTTAGSRHALGVSAVIAYSYSSPPSAYEARRGTEEVRSEGCVAAGLETARAAVTDHEMSHRDAKSSRRIRNGVVRVNGTVADNRIATRWRRSRAVVGARSVFMSTEYAQLLLYLPCIAASLSGWKGMNGRETYDLLLGKSNVTCLGLPIGIQHWLYFRVLEQRPRLLDTVGRQ